MSHTVLICDDAGYMRGLITNILTEGGYEVVAEAENGAVAVEKYKELQPDLVTMDVVMPEVSGIEALREIMKIDPNARVLMCTAIGQERLMVEAKEAGAKGFILKPFKPSNILDAMKEAVEK